MLHPSYADLMEVVNSDVEPGEQPVVQSRYSIVLVPLPIKRFFKISALGGVTNNNNASGN